MAQYVWFETSASSSLTHPTTPFRSRPPAQQIRLWLNAASSIRPAQHLWLNTSGSTTPGHYQRLNTFWHNKFFYKTKPMASYIWFEASASTPTPRTTPFRSTPPAQHIGLNTSGSTRLDQYFWLNASDSRPVAYHPRLNTFGATPTSIRQNLRLNTYGSKPLPRTLLLLPPPLGHHLWLNTSGPPSKA